MELVSNKTISSQAVQSSRRAASQDLIICDDCDFKDDGTTHLLNVVFGRLRPS